MIMYSYIDRVKDGIQFIIAIGSIVGLLGLIVGLLVVIFGGTKMRNKFIGVFIVSLILVGICGVYTGLRYFHIY